MVSLARIRKYFANISLGRLILWFYLIRYLVVLVRYFDPTPSLWLTAIGLSGIIGTALWINTTRSGSKFVKLERWPLARLYLFPFCVSSFSSLVKHKNFFLIFSPNPAEFGFALGLCTALAIVVLILKRVK